MLRCRLLGCFPQDGFLGEESGDTPGTSGYRWIIDPIDGTRSFVRGVPIWGTLVGLEYKGESLAGVVRAHMAAKEAGLKLLIGVEIHPTDAAPVVLWATDRKSYGRLSRLLTVGRRRAENDERSVITLRGSGNRDGRGGKGSAG